MNAKHFPNRKALSPNRGSKANAEQRQWNVTGQIDASDTRHKIDIAILKKRIGERSHIFNKLIGETELRRRTQVKPRKSRAGYKRKIDVKTDPFALKLTEFYKKNSSKKYKAKFDLVKEFINSLAENKVNPFPNATLSTTAWVLQELIKAKRIPDFAEHKVGASAGTSNQARAETSAARVEEHIARINRARTSPLFLEGRKFGDKFLFKLYIDELAKGATQERLSEIELVSLALNPTRNAEWFRQKIQAMRGTHGV